MIDPRLWADTPGMGRAPLLPDPQMPSTAVSNPRADIARLLMGEAYGMGNTGQQDRPVGALVRDPATMTQAQQIAELQALGGFPQEGRAAWTRAPSAAVTGMATLAGTGGLGLPAAMMSGAGVRQRQQALGGALTQGMAEAFERGSQARDQRDIRTPRDDFAAAYEAGRQAAVRGGGGSRDQARDRSDISRSSRGGSNQSRDSYAI